MDLWTFAILFLSVFLSGLSVLFITINEKRLKLILSFSGAYLFAISAIHLLPEVYANKGVNIGVFVLIGFFIQILLEFLTEGIEHGHVHYHIHKTFPYTMFVGLCIHSFLEGMPLADNHSHVAETLLAGLVLHKIPVAIALTTLLLQANYNKGISLFILGVFALITPIGKFVGHMLDNNMLSNFADLTGFIMALVVGMFLHISTTILFESSDNHRFNMVKFVLIVFGAGIAIIL